MNKKRKYSLEKSSLKFLKYIAILLIMFSVSSCFVFQRSSEHKAQRRIERNQRKTERVNESIQNKLRRDHFEKQDKETKEMMKKSKKRAKKLNRKFKK